MARDKDVSVWIRAKSAYKDAERKFSAFKRRMKREARDLARGIAVATAAVAAMGIALVKLAQRGGEVTGVQRAFARITGDSEAAVRKLREATRGLISDYELMKNANTAITLGAADNVDQFSRQARQAQALGRALGIDATFALEKYTVALARMSIRRLDDLGITLDVNKANQDYAKTNNIVGRELTEVEKRTAFVNAAMERADEIIAGVGDSALTNADKLQQMKIRVVNLKDEFGTMVAGSPQVASFFNTIADGLDRIIDKVPQAIASLQSFSTTLFDAITGGSSSNRAAGAAGARSHLEGLGAADVLSRGGRGLASQRRNAARIEAELAPLRAQLNEQLSGRRTMSARGLHDLQEEIQDLERQLATAEGAIAEYNRAVIAAARELSPAGGGGVTPGGVTPPGDGSSTGPGLHPAFAESEAMRQRIVQMTIDRHARQRAHAANQPIVRGGPGMVQGPSDEAVTQAIRAGQAANRMTVDAAEGFENAAQVAVGSFANMAAAAASGAEMTAQSIIGMVTNIASALPGVGGIGAAIIGGVGGILGGLLGRKDKKPVPIQVDSYSPRAMSQRERSQGPLNVIIRNDGGRFSAERAWAEINRAQKRDSVVRIPQERG